MGTASRGDGAKTVAAAKPDVLANGLLEPLQRMLGLPAFLSRETVEVTKAHLNYSSAKAKRYLGWVHPEVGEMWERIISDERRLMASRRGFLNKLRHQPTVF